MGTIMPDLGSFNNCEQREEVYSKVQKVCPSRRLHEVSKTDTYGMKNRGLVNEGKQLWV